jgi:hypothetical protein
VLSSLLPDLVANKARELKELQLQQQVLDKLEQFISERDMIRLLSLTDEEVSVAHVFLESLCIQEEERLLDKRDRLEEQKRAFGQCSKRQNAHMLWKGSLYNERRKQR